MRGTRPDTISTASHCRIIPADAGNTRSPRSPAHSTWDHPRGCGEHFGLDQLSEKDMGSSPRMRGTHGGTLRRYPRRRIIPADAGNTVSWLPWPCRPADHPRGCGEHAAELTASALNEGSSPRMRGTRLIRMQPIIEVWIIPADAGNTTLTRLKSVGESLGSSPRMRGTLTDDELVKVRARIIPADAGNTHPKAWVRPCHWDHPRGCGEHE